MLTTTMEDRVQVLERQVARQRRMFTAIVFAFVVIGVGISLERVSAADGDVPEVVKAKAFHVVDDNGSVLVELTARGSVGVVETYTSKKTIQTALGTNDEGGGFIACFNKKGEVQVNLGGDMYGGQAVVNAKSGFPRVVLTGDEDGGSVLVFNNEVVSRKLQ